jgi:hypothetical protein
MTRHPAKLPGRSSPKEGAVGGTERPVLAPVLDAERRRGGTAAAAALLAGEEGLPHGRSRFEDTRARGRPPRHEEPIQQTTIRLTKGEWAALQAQVTKETLARGARRYVTDIIRDAIAEYLARHG